MFIIYKSKVGLCVYYMGIVVCIVFFIFKFVGVCMKKGKWGLNNERGIGKFYDYLSFFFNINIFGSFFKGNDVFVWKIICR